MTRKRNREAGGQYAKEGTRPRTKRPPTTANERRLLAMVTSAHPAWFRAQTASQGLTLGILARKSFLERRLYSGQGGRAAYEYRASVQTLEALARDGLLKLHVGEFQFLIEASAVKTTSRRAKMKTE